MISVIIPLYNKEAFIKKAVDSVLAQSFEGFELLIVNDGSTDNSLEVVRQYDDARIRITDQENAGVSTARNNGVKAAKHELIAFLDADDWWAPTYLEEMLKMVDKYPEAGLWSAKYYYVKHGRNKEALVGLDDGFTDGYINYFKVYAKTMWMPVTSSSFVSRKEIFNNFGGFNPNTRFGEDFSLWVRMAVKHPFAYLNKCLVFYNQDVDSSQRAVGGKKIWNPKEHYIFNLEDLEEEEMKNPELKNLLDVMRLESMMRYHLGGKYRQEKTRVLKKVDFTKQSSVWYWKYHLPVFLLRGWQSARLLGSKIKARLKQRRIED